MDKDERDLREDLDALISQARADARGRPGGTSPVLSMVERIVNRFTATRAEAGADELQLLKAKARCWDTFYGDPTSQEWREHWNARKDLCALEAACGGRS